MAAPETPFAAGQDNLWTKILDHNKLAARQPGTPRVSAHVLLTRGEQASWQVWTGSAMYSMHARDVGSLTLSQSEGFTGSSRRPCAGFPRASRAGWGGLAELARCRSYVCMCCWLCRGSAQPCSIPNACSHSLV